MKYIGTDQRPDYSDLSLQMTTASTDKELMCFLFQAEDGIRDYKVTGVQTCALPIYADAAYGGYFVLAENLRVDAKHAFARIGEADSIVIDPHKHGLQPYGCGCVLFRDPGVGRLYKHDSPYTYFSSAELHLGEISLECSRPGASPPALWATHVLLPLKKGRRFAPGLGGGRKPRLGPS